MHTVRSSLLHPVRLDCRRGRTLSVQHGSSRHRLEWRRRKRRGGGCGALRRLGLRKRRRRHRGRRESGKRRKTRLRSGVRLVGWLLRWRRRERRRSVRREGPARLLRLAGVVMRLSGRVLILRRRSCTKRVAVRVGESVMVRPAVRRVGSGVLRLQVRGMVGHGGG